MDKSGFISGRLLTLAFQFTISYFIFTVSASYIHMPLKNECIHYYESIHSIFSTLVYPLRLMLQQAISKETLLAVERKMLTIK